MAIAYFLLVSLIYVLAIPLLVILSFKQKYKSSIPARFFLKNNPKFTKQDIWFHACSLGEVVSLNSIIDSLKHREIDISVVTQTGYKRANEISTCSVRYLPFEIFLPFWITKHRVLVVLEAELWPMLFCVAKLRGIKTMLINARISDNSYSGYKRFSWFYRWIFSNIDVIFAQSQIDKQRLEELGAVDVRVGGNIKASVAPLVTKNYHKPEKRVIILASSHETEEQLILERLRPDENDILIVAPRHPERFDKVELFLENYSKKRGLSFGRLSKESDFSKDILLCDKLGELVNLYAISDVVLLCGSFVDGIGGHNPLEPAHFGCKVVSGEYIFNQKVLFSLVENIEICSLQELEQIDFNLLKRTKIRQKEQMQELLQEIGEL